MSSNCSNEIESYWDPRPPSSPLEEGGLGRSTPPSMECSQVLQPSVIPNSRIRFSWVGPSRSFTEENDRKAQIVYQTILRSNQEKLYIEEDPNGIESYWGVREDPNVPYFPLI